MCAAANLAWRAALAGLATSALALATGTAAAGQSKEAFTPDRFEELQAQDELILIDVFADWCPVCAMQQEVLAAFLEEHPDVPLRILTVDFDTQKEWVRHFGAPRQSTLILYRGRERLWFSVAETRADRIVSELLRAAEPYAVQGS